MRQNLFEVSGRGVSTGNNLIITWPSVPNATYQVVGTTDILSPLGKWINVTGPITATGASISVTNPILPSLGFFEVESP